MEDGSITNDQITASGFFYHNFPGNARLNNEKSHWLSDRLPPASWIQVTFPTEINFTGLQTQAGTDGLYVMQVQVQAGDSEDTLSYIKDGNKTAVSYYY